jgi:hypothetical protein
MVERDRITGVELVDIRGTGGNTLLVDSDTVLRNAPFAHRLIVLGDADDLVDIGPGWSYGTEIVDGSLYDRYTQGSATLLVSQAVAVDTNDDQGQAPLADDGPTNHEPRREADSRVVRFEFAPAGPTLQDEPNAEGSDRTDSGMRQLVRGTQSIVHAVPGEPFTIDVMYDSDDGATTTGLHLRIHYDSSRVAFASLSDVLPDQFSTVQDVEDGICHDEENTVCPGLDGDPNTDRYLNMLWIAREADWPSRATDSTRLLTAHFIAKADLRQTKVRFSGHAAAGYDLVATPIGISSASGDVNDDGDLDAMDIDLVAAAIRDSLDESRFDLTRDDSIDEADRRYLIDTIFGTSAGDSDLDGIFNSGDLVAVFQAGKYEDGIPGNAGWEQGDWNGDGDFDSSDLVSAFQTGKYVVAAGLGTPKLPQR